MNRKLKQAATIVMRDCLGIKKNETVVIITDEPCRAIGYALWETIKDVTDLIIIEMAPRSIHGEEPPAIVAEVLKRSDVFIIPTSRSLTHTQARIIANKKGARGATMPGITVDLMNRTLNADYHKIATITHKATSLLTKSKKAHIISKNGTDLVLDLTGRKGHPDTGIIKKPGQFSNLPAGEAYVAPLENKSNGRVVVDGSFAPIGYLKQNVIVEVKNGSIKKISGNQKMKQVFNKYGKKERILCEFGIGTNPKAKIGGNVLEDEKVLGSIHVAFGNNLAFDGKNNACIHLDGVVKKPTVWLDKTLIIENGKFVL